MSKASVLLGVLCLLGIGFASERRATVGEALKNARLAVKYGLTPGLNISSPRSAPDSVLEKYPYIRGARVDHPFRSYRPRYTLTLSHPTVRWHYAKLMKRLMREVPELGYIYLRTNDSGSGFEYTASLYAGRNGGAYLVREWKPHEAIAEAAAANVLRYFRTLRDAAAETRPGFRLLFNLFSFSNEERFILDGLTEGLDLWVAPQEIDNSERGRRLKALPGRGSRIFTSTRLQNNFLLGIPSPWPAADGVGRLTAAGFDKATVTIDPAPLAPYDVNREILRALNLDPGADIEAVSERFANRLVGPERAYYERYMTVTFNNPNLVDLGIDILWTLMTREQADAAVTQADGETREPLDEAIGVLEAAAGRATGEVRAMIDDEVRNARALAELFGSSATTFMPVAPKGESFNMYRANLPELIARKIALMERQRDDGPRIDPDFMWRLPPRAPLDLKDYLKY